MNSSEQIAKHLREVFLGGNWTCVNLKSTLADVTWQEATKKIYDLNTIATLTHHIGYYVTEVTKVLQGGKLEAKDEYSFNHPPIDNQEDWEAMLNKLWNESAVFADLIEKLPADKLGENFTDEKYGIYYRNLHGIIEHAHYHLGQIVLIKKMLKK